MFRVWRTRFEFHENFEVNLKLFLKILTIFNELKELDEQLRQSSLTLGYSFQQSQQSYLCQKLVPTIMTIFSVSKTRSTIMTIFSISKTRSTIMTISFVNKTCFLQSYQKVLHQVLAT